MTESENSNQGATSPEMNRCTTLNDPSHIISSPNNINVSDDGNHEDVSIIAHNNRQPSAAALDIQRRALQARRLPPFVYEGEDSHGLPSGKYHFDYYMLSEHLHAEFHTVYYIDTLFIYDTENHMYHESRNEIDTCVRDLKNENNITDLLTKIMKEVYCHLKSMGNHQTYPFNNSTQSFPVKNGVLRYEFTSKHIVLLPHGPEHLFTYKLNVNYNAHIPMCLVMNVLRQWVDEDHTLSLVQIPSQAIIQMQYGLSYKKAHMLQGEPNAAKSTFIELLMLFFTKDYYAQVKLNQLLNDRFVGGSLENKLINIYDDIEDIKIDSVESFKTFTGSCNQPIERKHKQGYTGKISAVHLFSCNFPPSYDSAIKKDAAFWKRWEYVIFPNSFKTDPLWIQRTFTEDFLSSFLNVVLWGMIRILNTGELLFVSDVDRVMDKWSYNSDPIYSFIQRFFINNSTTVTAVMDKEKLFDLYKEHCKDKKIDEMKQKQTITAFSNALQVHGILPNRRVIKGRRMEVYETLSYQLTANTDVLSKETKEKILMSNVKSEETITTLKSF